MVVRVTGPVGLNTQRFLIFIQFPFPEVTGLVDTESKVRESVIISAGGAERCSTVPGDLLHLIKSVTVEEDSKNYSVTTCIR